jgi:hypothetical protein
MSLSNLANYIAPEHLELQVAEPMDVAPRIRNAGAIFWDPTRLNRWGTMWPVLTMSCRQPERRGFPQPCRWTTS